MIEDIFDEALNLEDSYYQKGYEQGLADGVLAGKVEGRSVGMKKGFEKFHESGRLYGRSIVWANRQLTPNTNPGSAPREGSSTISEKSADPPSSPRLAPLPENKRLAKTIETLHDLLEPDTLSTQNDDESVQDFDERLKKAQGKVKIITRVIGEKC